MTRILDTLVYKPKKSIFKNRLKSFILFIFQQFLAMCNFMSPCLAKLELETYVRNGNEGNSSPAIRQTHFFLHCLIRCGFRKEKFYNGTFFFHPFF